MVSSPNGKLDIVSMKGKAPVGQLASIASRVAVTWAGRMLREWWSEEVGQGLVEYGLILVLSALVAVVVLVFFGGTISAVLEAIGEAIERAS